MFATCIVSPYDRLIRQIQPVDMIKVRIQLRSEAGLTGSQLSPFNVARDILAKEGGVRSFYKGYPLRPYPAASTPRFSGRPPTRPPDSASTSRLPVRSANNLAQTR